MLHTPDYFVMRSDAAGWEEWKTEEDLFRLDREDAAPVSALRGWAVVLSSRGADCRTFGLLLPHPILRLQFPGPTCAISASSRIIYATTAPPYRELRKKRLLRRYEMIPLSY